MSLLNILRKNFKRNTLDEIKLAFVFLVTDFGFELAGTEKSDEHVGEYLVTYRNDQSKLQLEINADDNYFHCEFRRLINGYPASYSDKDNSIGFESLAIIESNNNYDHEDYFAGGRNGLSKVLKNTMDLFRRNKTFFTTDNWIDIKRIEQIKDEEFQAKWGFKPSDNKNKPTYFGELKKEATGFLTNKGFELVSDSDELPAFAKSGMVKNIIFSNGNGRIKLTQKDWRDDYYLYNIEYNGKLFFVMNIKEHPDIHEAVQLTMQKLNDLVSSL